MKKNDKLSWTERNPNRKAETATLAAVTLHEKLAQVLRKRGSISQQVEENFLIQLEQSIDAKGKISDKEGLAANLTARLHATTTEAQQFVNDIKTVVPAIVHYQANKERSR